MAGKPQPVVFEDARILFRNFSGKEGRYNAEGQRNFCLVLDQDVAAKMYEDGWNIKELKPRDEEDSPQPYVEVAVRFSGPRPPRVVMVTSRGKTPLGEDEVSILDWAEIKKVDMILNPYQWDVNGKQGIKAYLQTLFATIEEDELEQKYIDVPDSASSAMSTKTDDAYGETREEHLPWDN